MGYSRAIKQVKRGEETRNFKSATGYKKWLAYGHMNVKGFGKTPMKITIRGKSHKVKHT